MFALSSRTTKVFSLQNAGSAGRTLRYLRLSVRDASLQIVSTDSRGIRRATIVVRPPDRQHDHRPLLRPRADGLKKRRALLIFKKCSGKCIYLTVVRLQSAISTSDTAKVQFCANNTKMKFNIVGRPWSC